MLASDFEQTATPRLPLATGTRVGQGRGRRSQRRTAYLAVVSASNCCSSRCIAASGAAAAGSLIRFFSS